MSNSFHFAFKVKDLATTRQFYTDILGCAEGRSSDTWVDFDFFGNQISAHIGQVEHTLDYCGHVDGIAVPIPHFGCILTPDQFQSVQCRLEAAQVEFIVKPSVRYAGKAAQQNTMFVLDFSGNPLEFKVFNDEASVYEPVGF